MGIILSSSVLVEITESSCFNEKKHQEGRGENGGVSTIRDGRCVQKWEDEARVGL